MTEIIALYARMSRGIGDLEPDPAAALHVIRTLGVPAERAVFVGDSAVDDAAAQNAGIDFAWVSYEEAKKYDMVEGLLKEIEMVDKILNGEDENEVGYYR